MAALNQLRDKPSGTIRITARDHEVRTVLWPALEKPLPNYPDIKVEIVIDYGRTDIVAERLDAGIRSSEMVAKDVVAVRIGPGAGHYLMIDVAPRQPTPIAQQPIGRFGEPEEFAAAVVRLCSPAARFMVGHDMMVDGGLLAGQLVSTRERYRDQE